MLNSKIAIGAALAGSFVLGATVIAFSAAKQDDNMSHAPHSQVSTSFSELEEEEIGKVVRAYLLENPEVIIEAVNIYSMRQRVAEEELTRAAAAENIAALLDETTSFVAAKNIGKAKIAVVEMYDYHCSYCKRAAGLVNDLVAKDAEVKVVLRDLPILRKESDYAAEMSLASKEQGKFLEFYNALFEASGLLTKERVQEIAKKEGLDVAKMEKDIEAKEIRKMIQTNHDIAAQMQVEGTPTFIIAAVDGSYLGVVSGYDPGRIQDEIEAAKKAAK